MEFRPDRLLPRQQQQQQRCKRIHINDYISDLLCWCCRHEMVLVAIFKNRLPRYEC